jgi:hypothetical protein
MQTFQASAWAILLGLGLITGCSQGTICWLEGQVTFDGKPVEEGEIVLRPVGGTPGPAAPAKITGGKYEIPQTTGLKAGKFLILITAANKGTQYIPDRYNVASELTVDLQGGANNKDFSLERGEVTIHPVMKGEEGLGAPSK